MRTPAFWVLLAPVALTALVVALFAGYLTFLAPRSAAAIVLPLVAYAAAWLLLLRWWADPVERRPAWLVAMAVAWGATVAVAVGAGSGYLLDDVLARSITPTFAAQWGAALVAPTAEEAAKAAGVVLLLLAARPYFTTAWSGAIYGAAVGVGFTAVEDAGYALIAADEVLPDDAGAALRLAALRFLVPGFTGHPLFTAAAGAGIAYAWLRAGRPRRRWAVLAAAVAGSWLMHFAVNSPLAVMAGEALTGLTGSGVFTGYLLVVALPAVPVLWWLAALRRHDAGVVLARAGAVDPAAIRPQDIAVLADVRSRRRAERDVRRERGALAARAARRLWRAQVRLAAAVSRPFRGYAAAGPGWLAPPVRRWRLEVYAARQALAGPEQPRLGADIARQALAGPEQPRPGADAAPGSVTDGPGIIAPGRVAAARRAWPAALLLLLAIVGLAYWPVGVVAALAATGVAWWHWRRPGRMRRGLAAAVLAGWFCGYLWLVNSAVALLYPR
ncbi:MAG TPA: PrsW family glutamic-type intramembrane protease [Pilimelia sp.]|nr:PrsW family glutamic-type intramembrane protease [Pilimelia sp.]